MSGLGENSVVLAGTDLKGHMLVPLTLELSGGEAVRLERNVRGLAGGLRGPEAMRLQERIH